ncbi:MULTISPECIES: glycyl-radical enzyme activating protein [Clostridium]|uniref:4-hydroxyphenylacetate decarboxylase activating enzyme n=2 Tax=Clostridium TaxID=1485 RepID=A0A151APF1_9CLOT|nr:MULTISPECIES: glycyl-radical enzyme activating protein [Clostridium]KYH29508.1 4-hydroxyphenylacetate decarboxylase activating enzyme [Clostridium colicanis DSM 13634]PRR70733.1 4-hydroxyphenylacetate decarboxylase activating enzyme [Clostridium thermopalmarium DSM 5974]PVZ22585.1 pyruvate formate lyase activating enzyme [Clostridium thermopalmarium DSM 5974]
MLSHQVDFNKKGVIFDIQRYSVHDGPGIRTILFIKGCPLSCIWCSNPESQCIEPQIMFFSKNCIGCERCYEVCGKGAIDFNLPSRINKDKCVKCGKCVEVCYAEALNMTGNERTVQELLSELKKDNVHYRRSGGGITLSGGEALAQPEFTIELLKGCKASGFHTAIETTAFSNPSVLEKALPWLDLVMLDIKHMNSNKHYAYTGQSNELILNNSKLIAESGVPLIIRVPIIPTVNNDEENIRATANFAKDLKNVSEIHILPYHAFAQNKYESLGYEYNMKDLQPPTREELNNIKKIIEEYGFICKIGGID